MGEVYRARDTRLDRDVAVKVLPAALTSSAELRQRLAARLLGKVDDVNVLLGREVDRRPLLLRKLHPGCIHTFTVKELKDQGWDVCLKEGMNEAVLVAPAKAGDFKIECMSKCGKGHDDMGMKLTVTQ